MACQSQYERFRDACSLAARALALIALKDKPAGSIRPFWEPATDTSTRHRSEEHTSELQSLMRISYAVFCLKKKNLCYTNNTLTKHTNSNNNDDRFCYSYNNLK